MNRINGRTAGGKPLNRGWEEEIKGQEAGEERAGNSSSKKVRIIYYTLKYIQKQEPKMLFDLLILRLLGQRKNENLFLGLRLSSGKTHGNHFLVDML